MKRLLSVFIILLVSILLKAQTARFRADTAWVNEQAANDDFRKGLMESRWIINRQTMSWGEELEVPVDREIDTIFSIQPA